MDANEVIRGRAARGDGYGGVVDQQHSVVVALELKAFVWWQGRLRAQTLGRGDVVAKRM